MVMMGKMVQSSFRTACRSSCSSSCSDDGFKFMVFIGESEGECLDKNADSLAAIDATI